MHLSGTVTQGAKHYAPNKKKSTKSIRTSYPQIVRTNSTIFNTPGIDTT